MLFPSLFCDEDLEFMIAIYKNIGLETEQIKVGGAICPHVTVIPLASIRFSRCITLYSHQIPNSSHCFCTCFSHQPLLPTRSVGLIGFGLFPSFLLRWAAKSCKSHSTLRTCYLCKQLSHLNRWHFIVKLAARLFVDLLFYVPLVLISGRMTP